MKFKLIKDKEFFQIVCDQKSVKEITDWENKAYEIEWYASTKDKDRMNDVVEPTAFEDTLKQYMTNPIVLLQHDMDKPIGNVIEASIDDKGLFIKAKITEDTDGVFSKLKNGVLRTFSIWYRVNDFETIENVNADGEYSYTNIIKSLELFEISLVSVPANPFALVKSFDSCFKAEEDVETAEEEKPVETVEENQPEEEKVEDEENIEAEEETKENETEETEESQETEEKEEEKTEEVEEEVKEIEKSNVVDLWAEENEAEMHVESEWIPNEEAETEEINEEENENKEADENSEISTEVESQTSENDAESASNDESVDETSNAEVVEESKAMEVEHKSVENAEFKSFVKSFNEKLDEKDLQIKSLQNEIANQKELIKWAIEVMIELDHAIKNTAIQSWSSYQAPATKNTWYGKVAEFIKNLHNSKNL